MWKKVYKSRLTTGEKAVSCISSGDRIIVSHATGEPQYLLYKLVENRENYRDVEIVHLVAMGKSEYAQEGMEKYFRHNSLFVGATTRDAVKENRADYTPVFLSDLPKLLQKELKPDVALIQVSKPDKHGYVSLGVSVDYGLAAIKNADTVIAQVNKYMPRTFGNSMVHIDEIDVIVEKDEPLITLAPPKMTDIEDQIGKHIASLINDGDTLQLGIGSIPDAVMRYLEDKKDLGIHSEMISDGTVELIKKGIINNKRKNFMPGVSVVAFLMGTEKLYEWADDNPGLYMAPLDFTNNPAVIMKNDNLISINSCVEVDLSGQVVSSTIGDLQISGVGGQVDFVRGAAMSKGGKSIIAIPSTVKGKKSKIVSKLTDGSAVTTSRNDVDYIVTEYGVARLKGLSLKARAKALIDIAHPDFREDLKKFAEEKYGSFN